MDKRDSRFPSPCEDPLGHDYNSLIDVARASTWQEAVSLIYHQRTIWQLCHLVRTISPQKMALDEFLARMDEPHTALLQSLKEGPEPYANVAHQLKSQRRRMVALAGETAPGEISAASTWDCA